MRHIALTVSYDGTDWCGSQRQNNGATIIAPRYAGRAKDAPGSNSGYTRIVKLPARRGDAAPTAVLLLVE